MFSHHARSDRRRETTDSRRRRPSKSFCFHPQCMMLEDRQLLSVTAGVIVSDSIPPAAAVSSAVPSSTNSASVTALLNSPTIVGATTGGQTSNVSSPGYTTPPPAVVGVFAFQQVASDPLATPASLIPPQPSPFVAPPNAPLTGGDVNLANPNRNAAPLPDEGTIVRADAIDASLISLASDGYTETEQQYAAVIDQLAASDELPIDNQVVDSNLASDAQIYRSDLGFQSPSDSSPAPAEMGRSLDTQASPLDRRASFREWSELGAVAATAGVGLSAYRAPKRNPVADRSRRFRIERRPRW